MTKRATPRQAKKLDDLDVVLFQGEKRLEPGQVQLHSLSDLSGKLFGRRLQDVKADWKKVSAQVKEMMESVVAEVPKGFAFESVEVSLGFSVEGKLVFIAQAGVEASVALTFKRT
jgi:hypothetical protein